MLQASELKYRELEAESVVKYEQREKESGGICFGFVLGHTLITHCIPGRIGFPRSFACFDVVLAEFFPKSKCNNGWMLREG